MLGQYHPPDRSPARLLQERPATAPKHGSVRVPEAMLGRIIGPAGATVREIEEAHDARVDIQDSGECLLRGRCLYAGWWACVTVCRRCEADLCSPGCSQLWRALLHPACAPRPPRSDPFIRRPGPHLCAQPAGLPGSGGPHPGPGRRERQGAHLVVGCAHCGCLVALVGCAAPCRSLVCWFVAVMVR